MVQADTIHLEWQDLTTIDNLELFSSIRSLYLQYNLISKIENLEFLTSLEFLSLEGNNIASISGILTLQNLLYLNLANNKIIVFDATQVPKSISILKVGGNPFSEDISYRIDLINFFPELEELDNIPVLNEKLQILGIEYFLIRPPQSREEIKDNLSEITEETRPESAMETRIENHRFMTEDEEVQFCKITEKTWELVMNSKKRMEDLQKLREGFRVNK